MSGIAIFRQLSVSTDNCEIVQGHHCYLD